MNRRMQDSSNQEKPRRSLGRRMALVLLPLVLLPLIVMGGAAYLRAQAILRQEAAEQMISATQGQITTLQDWASERDQRLFLGTQRKELRTQLEAHLAGENPEAIEAVRQELEAVRRRGETYFSEVFIVRAGSSEVIASTNEDREGQIVAWLNEETLAETGTFPRFDDPNFAPGNLTFVSLVLIPAEDPSASDLHLVGINASSQIVQLMESLQIFWERRGVYRVERGKTFIGLPPSTIFELPRYGTALEMIPNTQHPVLSLPQSDEAGTLEYEDLEGEPVLGAYQWIPEWNLAVVVELPQADIFKGITNLAPFTIGIILLAATLTFAVVVLTTNRMLRPLRTLAEFAERISKGDWQYRMPEERKDELGALASAFNRMADELGALYQSLEVRVAERTRQIQTASEVARAVTIIPDLNELLRQAVNLIRDQFEFSHVSIFLLNREGSHVVLRESTGEVGEKLKAAGHRLEVGSESMIGWVTEHLETRVATDVSLDPIHRKHELLPDTRAEAVIPLQIAGKLLGVLDVHSVEADAFQEEDLEVLQTLADQLSAAIENARLAQASAMAAERARLVSEITGQLSGLMEPEEVLHTAARELHRGLGDAQIVVKLTPPSESYETGE